jgi:hypothetical protein
MNDEKGLGLNVGSIGNVVTTPQVIARNEGDFNSCTTQYSKETGMGECQM